MAFCSKCGAQMADGVRFCPNCGNDVTGTPNAQQGYTNQGYTNQGFTKQPNMNQNNYGQQGGKGTAPSFMNTLDTTVQYHPQDIAENKVMAVLSYLGILWLIPCFGAKQSPFARYHVKQGFLVICSQMAYEVIAAILCSVIKVRSSAVYGLVEYYHTPGFLVFILWIFRLIIWAMAIIGIINAAQGKAKELPFIGKYSSSFTFLN